MYRAILLIDDDPAVLDSLTILLEHKGFTVTQAHSGAVGLDLFKSGQFDLVVTDMNMPGLHGSQLVRALREVDTKLPIITMSGSLPGGASGSLEDALTMGANHLLDKPFEPQELIDAINSVGASGGAHDPT